MAKNKMLGFLIILFLCSCNNQSETKNFDFGKIEQNRYYNSFFKLELIIPNDWVDFKGQKVNKIETDTMLHYNEKTKKSVLASDISSVILLNIFEYKVGTIEGCNPHFMLMADNIANTNKVERASDYLYSLKETLCQTTLHDSIDNDFKKELINGQEFIVMNTYLRNNVKKVYYSAIKDGFCLTATISYANDEQKSELIKVLNSMKFNK